MRISRVLTKHCLTLNNDFSFVTLSQQVVLIYSDPINTCVLAGFK
jgi:hypothetical protein